MLSHSDIQTQKQQLKTRELQLELQLLKKNIEQGQLAPMIEKLVYQCIEKAQSSEPHSFRGGKEVIKHYI